MTNHVHLLVTPSDDDGPAKMMHAVNTAYVRYANRRYGRTGTLWEGRCKSALVESERYLFACSRYIELNPVRAGMVRHPADYAWSSYRHNAESSRDAVLTPHPLYMALDVDKSSRCSAYRALFDHEEDTHVLEMLRRATQRGSAVGTDPFLEMLRGHAVAKGLPLEHGGDRRSRTFLDLYIR